MWPFASRCAAGCPYCFSHVGVTAQVAAGARWWSDDEAVAAWRNVADAYGPGYILFSGLEPTEELPLVAAVLAHHYGSMATHLNCDLDEFERIVPPDRLELHPTFHPHLWGLEVEDFAARVVRLRAAGYRVPFCSLVAYPPYVPRLAEYVAGIRATGAAANVAPARMCTYQGRRYPESYTEEELAVLREFIPTVYTDRATLPPLAISRCGAGHVAACVMLDGTVQRCAQVGGMRPHNLFRAGNISFLDAPEPCPEETCRCAQMHAYHLHEDAV